MKKRFRLKKDKEFKRVLKEGKTWVHPLLVLYALPNDLGYTRFGFSVSKKIGKATSRNRAKRLMREAARLHLKAIIEGWDLILIARPPLREANFHQVNRAIEQLLRSARLLKDNGQTP